MCEHVDVLLYIMSKQGCGFAAAQLVQPSSQVLGVWNQTTTGSDASLAIYVKGKDENFIKRSTPKNKLPFCIP